jgi:hypothetical protein
MLIEFCSLLWAMLHTSTSVSPKRLLGLLPSFYIPRIKTSILFSIPKKKKDPAEIWME